MSDSRCFAVLPAAGASQRFGQPKLLLPCGGQTLIERVIGTWRASRVHSVTVVVNRGDVQLIALARGAGANVVTADSAPAEMKDSVRLGLDEIARAAAPAATDAWLVAPADMPLLSAAAIDRVIAAHRPAAPRIVVPTIAGRRGHPVLLPWPLAAEVAALRAAESLKQLFERHEVHELPLSDDGLLIDIDTPEDYRAALNKMEVPPSA